MTALFESVKRRKAEHMTDFLFVMVALPFLCGKQDLKDELPGMLNLLFSDKIAYHEKREVRRKISVTYERSARKGDAYKMRPLNLRK